MERRLAAVLIADVVGYGRLSHIDEESTRADFQIKLREVFEPSISSHHGRLVKTMGDGVLVEFHSVVDALRSAVDIQQQMAKRNAAACPERRLDFRIGVNLGDVIVEGDDIQGDGVNIAHRLQVLAEPGGIAISGTAYDHAGTRLPVGFQSLGDQQVKNVATPVRVYRVVLDPQAFGKTIAKQPKPRSWRVGAAAAILGVVLVAGLAWQQLHQAGGATAESNTSSRDTLRASLVVLPFDSMSDDKQQGYLADGITEDLTTELARIPGLFVISRNAAFAYRDNDTKLAEIAETLGVRYILEGSVRRVGAEMRINAQLIDSATLGHLWAERFDGQWSDVFKLQDQVVGSIAATLKLRLVAGQGRAEAPGGTNNPAAYEAFLRGTESERRSTPEDVVKAAAYYQQALQIDPDFGSAMAALAWVYWNLDEPRLKAMGISWDTQETKLYQFLDAASGHPSPMYYQLAADLLVRKHQSDQAIAMLHEAVALDPSNSWTYEGLSQAYIFNGQPKEGISYLSAAMQVDPGWNDWRLYLAGLGAFGTGKFEEAAASLEKIDVSSPEPWARFYGLQVLLATYGHLGKADRIAATMDKLKRLLKERDEGELTRLLAQDFFVFKNEADIDRLLSGLSKAGVPELPSSIDLSPSDRLTGPEMKSLIFGHRTRGRKVEPNRDYTYNVSVDGSANVTIGNWSRRDGWIWVQGDVVCDAYPKAITTCGVVFRNPSGTPAKQNEYRVANRWSRFEFSVVRQ